MAQDPIDEFIALPRDQQLSTLQKLSPEKQDKLLGEIKTRKSKTSGPTKPEGSPASRFLTSAGSAIGGAVSGLYQNVVEGPQNPEEAKWQNRGLLTTYRMLVAPAQQQMAIAEKEYQAAKQAKTPYQTAIHGTKEVGHVLAAALPGIGPWVAQTGSQVKQQIGKGDIAGAAGTAAGNIALYEAPRVVKGAAKLVKPVVRGSVEALTDTGPGRLKKMAQETLEKNRKAAEDAKQQSAVNAQKHQEDTLEALHKTRGSELTREHKVNLAKAEADKINARRTQEHAEKVKTVEAGNQAKMAEYEAEKSKAAEVEKAATQLETRRGQLARQIQEQSTRLLDRIRRVKAEWKDDSQYIRGENARVAKARAAGETTEYQPHGKLDVAYDQIRKATAGKTVPAESLVDSVHNAEGKLKGSDENIKVFRDILSKAEDDAANLMEFGDVIRPEHPRYKTLLEVYKQEGIPVGEPPVPLGFNDLKGYYSELGEKLAGGNLPGDVYQALRSLQQDIGNMMQKMANDSGVGTKFSQTQGLYRRYMETFRESTGPNHSGSPIAQALDAADPAYAIKPLEEVETAQRVRNLLTEFDPPTEGQGGAGKLYDNFRATTREFDGLGKPIKVPETPQPPKLEELPQAKEPIPPKPVPEAVRTAPPDRPPEVVAPSQTLGPEEIAAQRTAKSQSAAERMRSLGVRRSLNALMYTGLGAIASAAFGHPGWAIAELAQAPVVLLGSHALAALFDSPKFTERLAKISSRDLAAINKMPPQERTVFTQNLRQMADMAQKRRVPISSALKTFAVGNAPVFHAMAVGSAIAPSTTKSLQQLRQQAQRLQSAAESGQAPTPNETTEETESEEPSEIEP